MRVLFTSTIPVTNMSGAADGSIYADQQQRSGEVISFSPAGGAVEIVARIPDVAPTALAVLPDGRAVVGQVIAGKTHLVAVEKGKNPVDLLTTSEEINRPFAAHAAKLAFALGARNGTPLEWPPSQRAVSHVVFRRVKDNSRPLHSRP